MPFLFFGIAILFLFLFAVILIRRQISTISVSTEILHFGLGKEDGDLLVNTIPRSRSASDACLIDVELS